MIQRKKVNSSKINLTISLIFHSVLIAVAFFFAAREGMLGKTLKQITVTMAPKEKKPEPPKEKPAEPKPEQPKAAEAAKTVAPEPAKMQTAAAPPPASEAPMAAPPPAELSGFEFHDGAKEVQTTTDAKAIYKGLVEYALKSRWNRPEDVQDDLYVAEVDVQIDSAGNLTGYQWLKGSGDVHWDNSVKQALAQVKAFSHAPPKGFPDKFLVRFDVESTKTEPVFQANSR
jgi:outer membrane biosynthesis protein TonB